MIDWDEVGHEMEALTFDMRGSTRLAGASPLDGRVRRTTPVNLVAQVSGVRF